MNYSITILIVLSLVALVLFGYLISMMRSILINFTDTKYKLDNVDTTVNARLNESISSLREFLIQNIFKEHMLNSERLQSNVQNSLEQFKNHINKSIENTNLHISQYVDKTNSTINQQLKDVKVYLDDTLNSNLTKTTDTFNDITKRLTLIDAAQKRISELSTDIGQLHEILTDKQSRGAFGEAQLETIIRNTIPAGHFEFQATLSNSKRADCVLLLPEPTGRLAIDSKFPLESYRAINNNKTNKHEQKIATKKFKQDLKKHIQDIASKYIIPGETAECAIMFIPSESIFAEIHSNHTDLISESYRSKVWMASPTTIMAILNTANAVIKDFARQKEIGLIQTHLNMLSEDFKRFHKRIELLARHIRLANDDMNNVQASATKIISRFGKIEKVELIE